MSHTKHIGMFVSGLDAHSLVSLKIQILEETKLVITSIYPSKVNGLATFAIIPSGSKNGLDCDEKHKVDIEKTKEIIKGFDHDDGSNPFGFGIVEYGEFFG